MTVKAEKLAASKQTQPDRGAAIDQHGSLKKALSANAGDKELEAFKIAVSEVLTPHASAILLDPEWGLLAARRRANNAGLLLADEETTNAGLQSNTTPMKGNFTASSDPTQLALISLAVIVIACLIIYGILCVLRIVDSNVFSELLAGVIGTGCAALYSLLRKRRPTRNHRPDSST
jgi:hypothetical protein